MSLGLIADLVGVPLPVGNDRNHLSARGLDSRLRLGEGSRVDAAIRTPVSAVNDNGQRTLRDHLRQGDDASPLVGEIEGRQRIADLGRAGPNLAPAADGRPAGRPRRQKPGRSFSGNRRRRRSLSPSEASISRHSRKASRTVFGERRQSGLLRESHVHSTMLRQQGPSSGEHRSRGLVRALPDPPFASIRRPLSAPTPSPLVSTIAPRRISCR